MVSTDECGIFRLINYGIHVDYTWFCGESTRDDFSVRFFVAKMSTAPVGGKLSPLAEN